MPTIKWDTTLYDNKHNFVSKYGEGVVAWLQPLDGEQILDLGCGTGQLANEIGGHGAKVKGMDASPEMIAKAKSAYPDIQFEVKDATDFSYDEPFDAVFSNATLHWINKQEDAIRCIYNTLKPGGRFVFEMGGKYNVRSIYEAVEKAMIEEGLKDEISNDFWFFPSVAEYATLLEKQGFVIQEAAYFERETELVGAEGMKDWIHMFGSFFFKNISKERAATITDKAVELLRPTNLRDGIWYADYVRLRMKAIKH
ncbi:class I SAM-dependent methyltransferase [Danxiaibacter flavus]|uniref:Class I SAM-dependent methyltransferase n=1 Tax=Danxiaibacter flavus TaxID=3049108 RepID=A0ABV3ZCX0_9BACT|nr:class I SAM-dependent methyltransferase [Chitinophagaceae bacterium DXS]